MISNAIWLSWEHHRRNYSMSAELGVELYEVDFFHLPVIFRYLVSICKTVVILLRIRPKLIFVQNPSALLSLLIVFFCKNVVVDAHNVGVISSHGNNIVCYLLQRINHYVMRKANVTLVTNDNLAQYVRDKGGRPFVMPDPIPRVMLGEHPRSNINKSVVYICTYALDEPYLEVIKSAQYLHSDIQIFITGNKKGVRLPEVMPPNVLLTGFIPDNEFLTLLAKSDIIIDLTTREDCLVCGAYEAIAFNKPLILSNTVAQKEFFKNAAIYTENSAKDIAVNIELAIENHAVLQTAIRDFKSEQQEHMTRRLQQLSSLVSFGA
jgi:glycosyltransferase involved in cell wall biosynthesis